MVIDNKIKDEKLQQDINKEAAKISVLSSCKIDKYEYLTGQKILPSDQSRKIEQAKFSYSPRSKEFEKYFKLQKFQNLLYKISNKRCDFRKQFMQRS